MSIWVYICSSVIISACISSIHESVSAYPIHTFTYVYRSVSVDLHVYPLSASPSLTASPSTVCIPVSVYIVRICIHISMYVCTTYSYIITSINCVHVSVSFTSSSEPASPSIHSCLSPSVSATSPSMYSYLSL
ncbi:hypothetical protein E5288_WYG019714 [Bos mutus]|uniref:Uncharacterized protein n=1 Tax=Bos mutus TaxID=72004 RepID=A0A6B0S6Y6_9CETA|nr:hypothetical protein [Bos mutus]